MARDVAVQNTPAIVADDKEAVEHGKGNRGNGEEIHRGNGLSVITKKGEPALTRVGVFGGSFHPAGNRSFGNIKAKHEKFSVDAGSSPTVVLGHQLEDEIANVFRCRSSTHGLSHSRNHPPVPTESGAVPSDDGFGCDDEERLFPAGPASTDEQPEELDEPSQLWAWVPLEHDELLTKCQILEKKGVMRAKETNQGSEAESKETKHSAES
jgi:hypothetical protein